jgi:hypothetical protein
MRSALRWMEERFHLFKPRSRSHSLFLGFSRGHETWRFQINVKLDLGPASEKWRKEMKVMER